MIKLERPHRTEKFISSSYLAALMIEARMRGFPLLEKHPKSHKGEIIALFVDEMIDWLVDNFPDEFEK